MRLSHRSAFTRLARLILLTASVLVLSACSDSNETTPPVTQDVPFRADGVLDFTRADSSIIARIVIEIAESAEAQAQGLMYRRSLPDRGGMLFIDQAPSMRSFWMRNTPLALDILFVDAEGGIVNIVRRTTPLSDDRIESTAPSQYVVEVRAGFVDRYGITDEGHIKWERRSFEESN